MSSNHVAPPSAEDKERTAQLVSSLTRYEQVDLLAQALLREYMHRRGFKHTLKTFDTENPRDDRTISSRALMRALLNIPVEGRPSRLQPTMTAATTTAAGAEDGKPEGKKKKEVTSKPVAPTFMEELCSYRLTKRDYAQHARRRKHLESKRKHLLHEMQESPVTGKNSSTALQTIEEELSSMDARHEDLEDPSDVEISDLRAKADARKAEHARLIAEAEGQRAQRKLEKKQRKKKEKEEKKKEKKKSLSSSARAASHATLKAPSFLLHDTEGGERPRGGSGPVAVGSAWAPPGAATAAGSNRPSDDDSDSDSHDPFADARKRRDELSWGSAGTAAGVSPNHSSTSSSATMTAATGSANAGSAERPSFWMGAAGGGGGGGGGSSMSLRPLGGGGAGPRPLSGGVAMKMGRGGGLSLSSATGTGFSATAVADPTRNAFSASVVPSTTSSSAPAPMPMPAASIMKSSYTASFSSAASGDANGAATASNESDRKFTYDSTAVPQSSALVSTRLSPPPPPPPPLQVATGSPSFGGLGTSGASTTSPHTSGMRQGFGFRKDAGATAAAAAGSADRKARKVKLLLD